MRVFDKAKWNKKIVCPICKTQKKGQIVLIAIVGTQEGNNAQAKQVHLDCLDLWIDEKIGMIYQRVEKVK